MANGYLLPRADFTRNALIDLRGLNAGIDNWQARSQLNVENARQNKLMQLREQQMAQAAARANAAAGRADERFAWDKEKYATDLEMRRQELAQRGQLQGLQRERMQMELEAAKRQTPEARAAHAAKLGITDPAAVQRYALTGQLPKPVSPMDQAINNMVMQALPGASGGQQRQGGMQPMSAPGGPQGDPNLIRTQVADGGSQPEQAAPGIAGSMFAGMPPERIRSMAEAFMMSGRPGMKELGRQMIADLEKLEIQSKTRAEIDAKEFATSETLATLQNIKEQFKPEYQSIPYKFKMSLAALQDKLSDPNAVKTPEQQRQLQQLQDYAAYRTSAFTAMNQYIKAMTGAQMSEAEAKRLRRGIPDPGDEMLNGDSPTEFKAKLDRVMKETRMAMMRYAYAKKFGRAWKSIPLNSIPALINKRGNELFNQMRSQGVPQDQINERVKLQLKQDFGGEI